MSREALNLCLTSRKDEGSSKMYLYESPTNPCQRPKISTFQYLGSRLHLHICLPNTGQSNAEPLKFTTRQVADLPVQEVMELWDTVSYWDMPCYLTQIHTENVINMLPNGLRFGLRFHHLLDRLVLEIRRLFTTYDILRLSDDL